MRTVSIPGLVVVTAIVLVALLSGLDGEAAKPDCSVWSVKSLRLGMTLAELEAVVADTGKKPKRRANRLRRDHLGKAWYAWPAHRSRGRYNYARPEVDDPNAPIVSIVVPVGNPETETAELVDEMSRRLGPPIVRDFPFRGQISFGLWGSSHDFTWKLTAWRSRSCDTLVVLHAKEPVYDDPAARQHKEFILTLDSLAKVVDTDSLHLRYPNVILDR